MNKKKVQSEIERIEEEKKENKIKSIDIDIYNETNKISECKKILPFNVSNCSHIRRLISSLKYYSTLDIIQNKNDEMEFIYFFLEIYKHVLNDIVHLVDKHNDDLQQINESLINDKDFIACDVKQCALTARHYHRAEFNKENKKNVNDDKSLTNFYIEMMDGLHLYIMHLFDLGIRSIKSIHDIRHNESNDDKDQQIKVIDNEFKKLTENIEKKKQKYGLFERFQSNKFNINLSADNEDEKGIYCPSIYVCCCCI